jgi:hypothetical protein
MELLRRLHHRNRDSTNNSSRGCGPYRTGRCLHHSRPNLLRIDLRSQMLSALTWLRQRTGTQQTPMVTKRVWLQSIFYSDSDGHSRERQRSCHRLRHRCHQGKPLRAAGMNVVREQRKSYSGLGFATYNCNALSTRHLAGISTRPLQPDDFCRGLQVTRLWRSSRCFKK